jgi:hypothetical protein
MFWTLQSPRAGVARVYASLLNLLSLTHRAKYAAYQGQ